jgi:hypothetical protein
MRRKVHYNQGDEILEVVVKDQTGAKIEVRRCNLADEKECGKIMIWLKDKYGFKVNIDHSFLSLESELLKI